jgi:hypothetical protein
MIPTEVQQLLHERAGHVHVRGDFAETAIAGARRVRTRRAVTAATTAALAVAVSFGLVLRDVGQDRGNPAIRSSESTSRVVLPVPAVKTATARVGAPAGPMPLPYIQAGLLHLGGRTVSIPDLQDGRLQLFAALSNGGVVFQVAGPDPATPSFDPGPLTFLDRDGRVVSQQTALAQADTDGRGDRVTAVADSGELVAFDVTGTVLRRLAAMGSFQSTAAAQELGADLVANLAGDEEPEIRVGSLDTGRSAYLDASGAKPEEGLAPLALHDDRTLLVEGVVESVQRADGCKYLYNYLTGEQVRSWCDDTRPIGFSPDGSWMYGEYWGRPGVWVARTDDGARLLEIRTDDATEERFIGEFAAPSPDGTALLVVVAAEDGQAVTSSCAIATGECRVLSDGLNAPVTGWLALPDNWGRQYPN